MQHWLVHLDIDWWLICTIEMLCKHVLMQTKLENIISIFPMQRSKSQRYRFSLLTQELRQSETEEYSACILAFINCILAGVVDFNKRVKLRNEFIGKPYAESCTAVELNFCVFYIEFMEFVWKPATHSVGSVSSVWNMERFELCCSHKTICMLPTHYY